MEASRFGGAPDVTRAFSWPRIDGKPQRFLAQIDLAALPDVGLALPRNGSLVFFADTEARDRKGVGRVEWFRPHYGPLQRADAPRGASGPLCTLSFEPVQTLPHILHQSLRKVRS